MEKTELLFRLNRIAGMLDGMAMEDSVSSDAVVAALAQLDGLLDELKEDK